MNDKRLEGKVTIITGAGSGIGRGAALMMAQQGAVVYVTDIDLGNAQQTQHLIEERGDKGYALKLDVTDQKSWQAVFDEVVNAQGRVDVLVNNAGIAVPCPIVDLPLKDFRKLSDINVHGTFMGCKGAIAVMRDCAKEGEPAVGSIINVASAASQLAMASFGAYCTSKAAVANMCNVLGIEMGEAGEHIRVNSVNPGPVKTEMTLSMYGEDYYDNPDNFAFLPGKTYAEVEDVAHAIVYLASDESRLVTGSHMNVDSGLTTGLLVAF